MDPNNPQNPQQNEPPIAPQSSPLPQQPTTAPQTPQSSPKEKKTLRVLIIIAIVLFVIVPITITIMSATGFVNQELSKDKTTTSQSSNVDLVERKVTQEGRSASVLVPSGWKDINQDASKRGNAGDFQPEFSTDEHKKVSLEIIYTGIATPTTISEEAFKPSKERQIANDKSVLEETLKFTYKNCDVTQSEYEGLEGRSYGTKNSYTCDVQSYDKKSTKKLTGVTINLHMQDGTSITFKIENTDPNKLDQATFDKIVKSLKLN